MLVSPAAFARDAGAGAGQEQRPAAGATEEAAAGAAAAPEVGNRDEMDGARLAEDQNGAVVTASGAEEERALASANVTSVGWEEIQQRGYRSLADILADVPGLYVVDDLVQPQVAVRGATGGFRAGTRIVKIMINGVPVNFRPDLTAFIGPEYLPVEMIERVEVAKGPLSALHGANAFLATVNVITRGQSSGVPVIAEASGRMNFNNGGAGWGGSLVGGYDEGNSSLIVAVTADRFDRSGLSIQQTFPEQDPELASFRSFFGGSSEGDLSHPVSAYAQYRARHKELGTLLLQGGVQRLDAMGEFQLNSVLTHQSRVSLENDWLSLRHEQRWTDAFHSAAWVGWSRGVPTRDEELYLTGNRNMSFRRGFRYHAVDGALELTGFLGKRASVKGGVDVSYEPQDVLHYTAVLNAPQGSSGPGDELPLVGEGDTTRIDMSNVGAYLQLTGTPAATGALSRLQLTGNARVDMPNLFPAQLSWRTAMAYRFSPAVTAKLIAGRAFQSPSATLLYGLPGFGSQSNVIGNRTITGQKPLVPQVVHSVEAAASFALMQRLGVELGVYAQRVNDRIEFVRAGSHFQARNQGQQEHVGVEASGRYVHGRYSLHVAAGLQRELVDHKFSREATALYPDATALSRLNIAAPEVHLNLNGQVRWVSPRGASQSNVAFNNYEPYTLPSYATVDLTASTLGLNFLGGAQTTVQVAVRNLFDVRYAEPGFGGFDLPVQGRTAIVELRQAY